MNTEIPVIWTAKGNLPLADLGNPEIIWERTPTYTKIRIIHRLGDELVREECHVLSHEQMQFEATTGALN